MLLRVFQRLKSPSRRRLRVEQLESRDLLSTLPAGFQEELVTGGLYEPTSMVVAPDGRLFVTEKPYDVRVVQNGQLLSTPLLSLAVNRGGERGVQSVALDPSFSTSGYFYVYYTHATASGAFNRLSRFKISASNANVADPASERILLDNIPAPDPGYHNGGLLQFGADGMLYLGVGFTSDTAYSQDLAKLQGKILRLNPNGASLIPSDNPFVGTSGARGEIWALGLRNPFTGDMLPGTSRLMVGDVGGDQFEEINEITKGANYGFPLVEGSSGNAAYTNPLYAYPHGGGAAVVGGEFYTGGNFPASYSGKYFFADYVQGFIKTLDVATKTASPFATNVFIPIDFANAPDGSLYWLSLGPGSDANGAIYKIRYVGTNRAPVAVAAATPINGPTPLTVSFSGTGSSDPDGDPLTYAWTFGDGQSGTGATISHTYTAAGAYSARLTVGDGKTTSQSTSLTITVGNTAPTATITLPTTSTKYRAGDTISFSGKGTDPEQGTLPASALSWSVVFHHDTHTHPFISSIPGVASGTFTIPLTGEPDPNQWYRVALTVTDAGGLKGTTYTDVRPYTSTFTLASNVAGASLLLDGSPVAAGTATTGVVKMTRTIAAPATQLIGGRMYKFVSWSDGGAAQHNIATPATATTFTAQYQAMPLAATYSGTIPTTGLPNQTVSFPVTVTNVGSQTWSSTGTNKVRLAVYFDGTSDAVGAWTKEPVRFALPGNVVPGQSVTIQVSVKSPATPGTYVLRARMVKENVAWFETLQKTNFQVQSLQATYAGMVPTVWSAGQSQTYSLTVTNTGTATWNHLGTDRVRLAVYFGGASDIPGTGNAEPTRIELPRDVAPGQSITLSVQVKAPPVAADTYTLRQRMVKETYGYFADMLRTTAAVEVFSAKITGSPPTIWLAGETKTYTVTVMNLGSKTWNATGTNKVRLGVYFGGASDAVTAFPYEPLRFVLPHDVRPEESVTITVTIRAPAIPGTYILRNRMVKEGVNWGNEILKTNVTVQ